MKGFEKDDDGWLTRKPVALDPTSLLSERLPGPVCIDDKKEADLERAGRDGDELGSVKLDGFVIGK